MTRQRDYIILEREPRPAPTLALIKAMVADHYRIATIHIDSGRKERKFARPRQVVMFLARELTGLTMTNIARRIGGRDHTTVLYGIRQIERLRLDDADLSRDLETLTARLAA